MIKTIDGAAFSRMMLSAAAEIDLNKQKVNELNVFPVPPAQNCARQTALRSPRPPTRRPPRSCAGPEAIRA